LFEIHGEFTKLEKIEFTGIKGKQLSSQTIQIYDDFNELYKKFTFVSYDPLHPEDDVSTSCNQLLWTVFYDLLNVVIIINITLLGLL